MMSSLSTIIWGESSNEENTPGPPTTTIHWKEDSPDDDDWVVVGRVAQSPGTLGGTFSLPPPDTRSSTPLSLSPPCSEIGDDTMENIDELVEAAPNNLNTNRSGNPRTVGKMTGNAEQKQFKSAQIAKQRYRAKTSSRKMLKRSNQTAMANGRSRSIGRKAFQFKMAGANRNLKQC